MQLLFTCRVSHRPAGVPRPACAVRLNEPSHVGKASTSSPTDGREGTTSLTDSAVGHMRMKELCSSSDQILVMVLVILILIVACV